MSRRRAWAAAGVAGALALLWVTSLLVVVRMPVPSGTVRLCFGAIDFFSPATDPPGFSVTRRIAMPPALLPSWGTLRGGPFVVVPLWIPAAIAGSIAGRLLRRAYAIPPGHCRACRYDLRGNTSGRCPECGAEVPAGG